MLAPAEKKHAASQVILQPEVRNEEGLPVTEIIEELDADGNVICMPAFEEVVFPQLPQADPVTAGSTSEPGQMTPQLVEALQRNGVTDIPVTESTVDQKPESVRENTKASHAGSTSNKTNRKTPPFQGLDSSGPTSSISVVNDSIKRPSKSRKSVSFAEEVKVDDTSISLPDSLKNAKSRYTKIKKSQPAASSIADDKGIDTSKKSGLLYDEEEEKPFNPVIPLDESPEDAALRREMIKYNMGEVGAIVAELDLDENSASYSEDGSGEDEYDNSSFDEDEDQFGRTKQRVLTNDYLAEMQKLQQRLKNVGPAAAQNSLSVPDNSNTRQEHEEHPGPNKSPSRSNGVTSKEVRFAKELEIQEAPKETQFNPPISAPKPIATQNAQMKHIHTPNVVERPFTGSKLSSRPTEPDEYDPGLLRQEVRTEYHRMRNHMIQKQGGFTSREEDDETDEVPLAEAEGGPKKMSRFKAARLGKSGM